MKTAGFIILAAAVGIGCTQKKDQASAPAESVAAAEQAATTKAKPKKKLTAEDVTAYLVAKEKAKRGANALDDKYVPAEFKSGKKRWRDATAYVDGEPVGMFWFGELPATMEPIWIEEKEDIDWSRKKGGPMYKIVKSRRYRLADYLAAVGVPLEKIKMIHIYGPNGQILPVDKKQFKQFRDTLRFRFGGGTEGKAIPDIPRKLGRNFDRLMGICVYIKKKPPTLNEDQDVAYLNGKVVEGVPYFGEPLRGGIRVYKNDRMVTRFKRNKLNTALGTKLDDDTVSYKLLDVLKDQGVKIDDIVQLEVIHEERRGQRFDRSDVETMTFRSVPQAKGQIQLNKSVFAHSIALYTKKLPERTASVNAGAPDDYEP